MHIISHYFNNIIRVVSFVVLFDVQETLKNKAPIKSR